MTYHVTPKFLEALKRAGLEEITIVESGSIGQTAIARKWVSRPVLILSGPAIERLVKELTGVDYINQREHKN